MKRIIFLLIIFVLASCRSLDERNEECIENMPAEAQGYVREFLHEGEKRGKKIDLKKLQVKLTTLDKRHGQYVHDEHVIELDYESRPWKEWPEVLVFHELGHGVLKKPHDDSKQSIMSTYPKPFTSELDRRNMLDDLFN